jgi:hypothetical protein
LHHDILTTLIPFLASSPSTLATLCLVSKAIRETANRQLYHSITLSGTPATYQLFFAAHSEPHSSSPCIHTHHLTLGRHLIPPDTTPYNPSQDSAPVTSLYAPLYDSHGTQLSDLSLPHISSDLFPNLRTLNLDVHRTHLASILPILITLDPEQLVIGPHEPLDRGDTASAYLPHQAFSRYTKLRKATIISTDLHPPDSSDYPPYGEFPFPLADLPGLRKVEWVYATLELTRGMGRGFFQNLVGLLAERSEDRVVEVGITLVRDQGHPEGYIHRTAARINLVRSLEEAATEAGLDLVQEVDEDGFGEVWSVGERIRVTLRETVEQKR